MPDTRRFRHVAIAVVAGAATAVSLAACSGGTGSAASSAPATSAPASSAAASKPAPTPTTTIAAATPCDASADPAKQFKLGTFLPLTGNLAFLAPAAIGAAGLALQDVNAAGGVNGTKACSISTDSSDTTNPTIGSTNAAKLLQSKVSAILGAESSSVTESVLSTISGSGTVMFSPANTDDKLTGISKWYFRDAPPNSVEGNALGKQILADGHSKVGILVFNDSYGTNLRDATQKAVEAGGGSIVYGAKGKNQEFAETASDFSSDISGLKAAKPDAIVVIAFDQTAPLIKQMVSAKVSLKSTYFVDGNLADYTATLPANTLTGVKGSTQGVNPTADFKKKVQTWYSGAGGNTIGAYGYAAESYDGVVLMALAADEAKTSSSAGIQSKLLAVSGANGGTVCKTYADCLKDIKAGKSIHYEGYAGIGPLNAGHDPSSGFISIYQAQGNNFTKFLSSVKG